MTLAVVLLAAGHGTRMRSRKQKILHEVAGQPMISHVLAAAESVADTPPVVVIAPGDDAVRALLDGRARFAFQDQPLGTGHATLMAASLLQGRSAQALVTYGDMPLLRSETMRRLAAAQAESEAAIAMLTVMGASDSTFGRVLRDANGDVLEIVEVAQARRRPDGEAVLAIPEHNAGVYCFAADWLWQHLRALPLRQARRGPEYYLTDMVGLAVSQGRRVVALVADDADEGLGAGTRAELAAVEAALRRRVNRRWLEAGVTLMDPDATYIEPTVTIGQDTVIWPNCHLQGATVVGEGCVVGPNTILRNARLGAGARVEASVLTDAAIAAGAVVGPFEHLRGEP